MVLEVLAEITRVLEKKGMDYWVMGGYGLDLAVGRVTRKHKNIDILVRIRDAGKVKALLEKNGYKVDYVRDKLIAKDGGIINIITMDEFKDRYVIDTLNSEVLVPKSLMNRETYGEIEGVRCRRIPNELLYLFMRYSPNEQDSLIVSNLSIDKSLLKSIKIKMRPVV